MFKRYIPAIIAGIFVVAIYKYMKTEIGYITPLKGKPLPEAQLPSLTALGDHKELSSLNNGIIFVFAPWCGHCHHQIPTLQEAKEKYGINLYAIAWHDGVANSLNWIDNFVEPGLFEEIMLDENGEELIKLGIISVPETILVDKEGKIITKKSGQLDKRLFTSLEKAQQSGELFAN